MQRNIEIENQIKKIIQKYPKNFSKILKRKENNYLLTYINQQTPLLQDPIYNISTKLNWIFNNITQWLICPTCGKHIGEFKNIKITKHYGKHCCTKCSSLDPQVQNKSKNTNLQKYGVQYTSQADIIKQKQYKTNLQRYGYQIASKAQIVKNKAQQTCLKKYGTKSSAQNQQVKEKVKQTNLQKYGTTCTLQSPEIKEKAQNTLLKKYNVTNAFASKQIQQKIKQANIQKFGVQNYTQTQEYKIKTKETNLKKFGYENICKTPEYRKQYYNLMLQNPYIIPLFSFETYFNTDRFHDNTLQWKCLECGNIITGHANHFKAIINNISVPIICRNCHPYIQNVRYSNEEKEVANFCKQYFPKLSQNNYQLISPYQVDIYIQELNLAIQFNGSYWHSIQNKPAGYHLMKTQLCNQRNVRLIHIWQDQWVSNKQQIKQKLVKIFKNQQIIPTNIQLDFSWYNNINFDKYVLKCQKQSKLRQRNNCLVQDCGSIILDTINCV